MTGRNLALVVADRLRRRYWRLVGPRTVGVRTIVRNEDGDVVLVRHSYGRPEWHLPGGGVRRREALDDAARRETREETGIRVADDPGALTLHGVFSNLREGKSDHIAVFVAHRWRAATGGEEGDAEIAAVAWFPPSDPPADTSPGTRRRLLEVASGVTPGFRW